MEAGIPLDTKVREILNWILNFSEHSTPVGPLRYGKRKNHLLGGKTDRIFDLLSEVKRTNFRKKMSFGSVIRNYFLE